MASMSNAQPQSPAPVSSTLTTYAARFATIGVVGGILFPVIATLIKVAELGLPATLPNLVAAQAGDAALWITDTAPFVLGVVAGIAGHRQDLFAQANALLRDREAELTANRANLEARIAERTEALDKRNEEMRSVIAFARQVAEIQDLPALLSASVQIISERFQGYAASLYLLDETGHIAVLRSSATAAGKALVKEGYRVTVGDQSVVGRVARRGKLLISQPKAESLDQATKAAAVSVVGLPLVVRGKLTGVLEVQVQRAEPVTQTEAELLQLLADQLAAAIENARLVTASRATVDQLESVTAEGTRKAWQEYLKNNVLAYQFTPSGVKAGLPSADDNQAGLVRVPVRLRGQEIGSISLRRKADAQWTETEEDLLDKLATQLALALENARLIEETRQRVAQEQTISEISARFSRSLDVDALLQAAVREFAALPEVAEASVVLKPAAEGGSNGNHGAS